MEAFENYVRVNYSKGRVYFSKLFEEFLLVKSYFFNVLLEYRSVGNCDVEEIILYERPRAYSFSHIRLYPGQIYQSYLASILLSIK